MLSDAYAVAEWALFVFLALALVALGAIIFRLVKKPRERVLAPALIFVLTAALCLGSFFFLRTRVEKVGLNSIREVGLEVGHDGLRTNALVYNTQVSLTAELKAPGFLGHITSYLVHKTTNVKTQVAVYGLIDFTTVKAKVATVNRQAKTITLSLPDPEIGQNTTYISAVNGVQESEGPVSAAATGITGFIGSLFHLPVVSVNTAPELKLAEARALRRAQSSPALATCGKEEIVAQLTGIFHLVPAYQGYTVIVHWPVPPDRKIDCAALQSEFLRSGGD
ncbi:MAG TPA: hypothetical protein VMA95_06215 [Streptosporangiaceae bacterium]|nr:hypothetical protein [Streptosporangiaceae bacterium]